MKLVAKISADAASSGIVSDAYFLTALSEKRNYPFARVFPTLLIEANTNSYGHPQQTQDKLTKLTLNFQISLHKLLQKLDHFRLKVYEIEVFYT